MAKQVSSAQVAQVSEANQPRVYNSLIAGGRRNDAKTSDGGVIEGINVYLRDAIPVIIDGEEKMVNKKWFAINMVIDALIMSEDDSVAAKAVAVMDGDYMALRGATARISVYEDADGELHYKVEF